MYSYGLSSTRGMADAGIWIIISVIIGIVGGIVLYFTFLGKKNETKFTGFLGWLYDFLSFKKMFAETLLKITYLIFAIIITLSSFAIIGQSFLSFLLTLIIGNVSIRIMYEFMLIALVICRNTTEINKKLTKMDDNRAE